MDVIGHQDGGDHIPFRQADDCALECGKGDVICQHRLAVGYAEGEEIDDRLIPF